ncbi:MAG TPA: exodeoxyribonuclease VII small subunit [Firmicutes bacterium]|nr:exodeoxyribonuclease VII small subunit [Candidatus Fermentithermobacillaceae bacterium]
MAMSVPEEMDFAKALKRLEEIVRLLESGELSLEESLAKFEEGIGLARQLQGILDRAEQRVQEILAGPKETEPGIGG